jgi:hypothetical protein
MANDIPLSGSTTGTTSRDREAAVAALRAVAGAGDPARFGSAVAQLRSIAGDTPSIDGGTISAVGTLGGGASAGGDGEDGDEKLRKALESMTALRDRLRKSEGTTSGAVEAVEKAHRALAEEHLQRHSGGHRRIQELRAAGGQLH